MYVINKAFIQAQPCPLSSRRSLNMSKRILAIILCVLTVAGLALSLSGCSEKGSNYPVTVGHTKIKKQPEKVCVLSDNIADIIYYLGYSTQICAISTECTQEEITRYNDKAVVGSETTPDADAIINSGAEIVFTDKALSADVISKLAQNDIEVINMIVPETAEQLRTLYVTLGTVLAGATDGNTMGSTCYDRVMSTLQKNEDDVNSDSIVKLFCYLYLDEYGNLCSFSSETAEGFFLEYMSATNVASNFPEKKVEQNILKRANPEFIFYDSAEVLQYLTNSTALSSMTALKNNNTFLLPITALQRQGVTILNTQRFMLSKMFPDSELGVVTTESLAERYGIVITDETAYESGAEHADIIIIQQRLMDLGYLVLDEGESPVDYYGNKTTEAVKSFQTANGLEATGNADNATLKLLFASTTLGANGSTFIPGTITPTEPATEETTEPSTENAGNTQTGNYSIDLSEYKTYDMSSEPCDDIKAINQRLKDLGYLDVSEIGNEYDWMTSEAVAAFQEEKGMYASGGCDYDTLKALFGV